MTSPFLELPESEWVASNSLAFAIRDRFPVSPGHTLVIPRRLVASWFEATEAERNAIFALVDQVKAQLDAQFAPDGYNVGFNAGEAAGQTVFHLHVHVIPRYRGDMEDPAGGVRHAIPWQGNYRRSVERAFATGGPSAPFLALLQPLFARATDVAVVAAFVQDSGLDTLREAVFSLAERGGRIRLITGDYLGITQAEALERVLDWEGALGIGTQQPRLATRVIETEQLPGAERSFHPKSWRFEGAGLAVAFVGSSNLSRSALTTGTEWNLGIERRLSPGTYQEICQAFEALWQRARPLTPDWVAEYSRRARAARMPLPPGESEAEPAPPVPQPHQIQQDALGALAQARGDGRRRALVVLATGLGKTWLAAFDAEQFRRARQDPTMRVLYVAHRDELLVQGAETFRRLCRESMPRLTIGWFAGERAELDADIVMASVQKLSRGEHLERLAGQRFDYVVVDEVHHADAPSYRRILERLDPGFLLGLTATPERSDNGDVLGLFDDYIAYRADLDAGIDLGRLVPFAYFGLKDLVDYANIPWRNRRFDPEVLAAAVQTQERMERLWEAWCQHPADRTLVFCCSIAHARFVCAWLTAHRVRAVAVYASPGSADREQSLRDLANGSLEAVCAVDLFNEGIDVPGIDRVVMLRPTESSVLFLQQLGRGLRTAPGKQYLTVIDFVGNHIVFLRRIRTLLSFCGAGASLRHLLESGTVPALPAGCSVKIDLEAVEILQRLVPSGRTEAQRVYRELRTERGVRPTAGEVYRMGYLPSTVRQLHGSWFEFVGAEGDLTEAEQRALAPGHAWFRELETTAMTKCFKMVLLEALLEADSLGTGMGLDDLSQRSYGLLRRSPELLADLAGVRALGDPHAVAPDTFASYWRKNPVAAWLGESGGPGRWFALDAERLVPRLPIPAGDEEAFAGMTQELVDYRLAQYRNRQSAVQGGRSFECKVTWNQRDPILKLPSRTTTPDLPSGEVDVRTADGSVWRFRFMKEFCNVASPVGSSRNQLPDLARRWFGPAAGRPGTGFRVRFYRSPDGWWVEPAGQVIELRAPGKVVAFPTLRAAAGAVSEPFRDAPGAEEVLLRHHRHEADLFAVRATGDSMDGGSEPIRDGDWLLFRFARSAPLGALSGKVCLMQTSAADDSLAFQVKRLVKEGEGWRLRSDNRAYPSFPATPVTVPIAVHVDTVQPEQQAPPVGTVLGRAERRRAFAIEGEPHTGRFGGHLFLVVDQPDVLVEPDRIRHRVPDRRPSETAYVLAASATTEGEAAGSEGVAGDAAGGEAAERWTYCGVARWDDTDNLWALPAVSYDIWRHWGTGRSCSRRLPPDAEAQARSAIAALVPTELVPTELVSTEAGERWIEAEGRRCRILGLSANNGVRIDGGPGGFAERVVSATDIAWVLVARDDVRQNGGLLDEARANRLRYLEGTPKASTRRIDTRWALALVHSMR